MMTVYLTARKHHTVRINKEATDLVNVLVDIDGTTISTSAYHKQARVWVSQSA